MSTGVLTVIDRDRRIRLRQLLGWMVGVLVVAGLAGSAAFRDVPDGIVVGGVGGVGATIVAAIAWRLVPHDVWAPTTSEDLEDRDTVLRAIRRADPSRLPPAVLPAAADFAVHRGDRALLRGLQFAALGVWLGAFQLGQLLDHPHSAGVVDVLLVGAAAVLIVLALSVGVMQWRRANRFAAAVTAARTPMPTA